MLLLAILGLWQVATLVHLITSVHVICPHGEIIEASGHGDGHHRGHGAPDGDSKHDDNDNCGFLDQLTTARVLPHVDENPVAWAVPAHADVIVDVAHRTTSGRKRYRLSPSHSPPGV